MDYKLLISKYFAEHSLIESTINSFNHFVSRELQKIIKESEEILPSIIPEEFEDFRIRFGKVWVTKPELVEADGSKKNIFPMEARIRQLTYSAPIYLEVNTYVDGVQKESFTSQIAKLPIMVRSKYCHLSNLSREELINKGEDPDDFGGYFIINGNERVLINVEDLASNKLIVEKNTVGPSKYIAKLFSERGSFRIPHLLEQMKSGMIYLSFTTFKRVPVIIVIKALGLVKDKDIMDFICEGEEYDEVFINLYDSVDLKTEEDALNFLAKRAGISQPKELKLERVRERLDRYLLPHIGVDSKSRMYKAYNLCKLVGRFLKLSKRNEFDDKDHYMNKRIKLAGDLLAELFRVNMRVLVNDMLYNFQRLVKRGKFHSTKVIIREKLLSSRIKSAIATGAWPGGRKGISQNLDRTNFLSVISHLQRVVSLLSTSQENFDARALHPTHYGRLCPIETPEGTPIGLRKNMSVLCNITSSDIPEDKVKKILGHLDLK